MGKLEKKERGEKKEKEVKVVKTARKVKRVREENLFNSRTDKLIFLPSCSKLLVVEDLILVIFLAAEVKIVEMVEKEEKKERVEKVEKQEKEVLFLMEVDLPIF